MTTAPEIASGSVVVGNTETVVATLAAWHPLVDVYVDPAGQVRADGTLWRVYAVNASGDALIAEGKYTFDGNFTQSQRVLGGVQGVGTSFELRAVTDGVPTSGPMTGIIVGWDPSAAIVPDQDTNGASLPIVGAPTVFGTLAAWYPTVDGIVDASVAGDEALGTIWDIVASFPSTAGFPDCIVYSRTLTGLQQAIFRGIAIGAETVAIQARSVHRDTNNVSAYIVGHSGSGGGGGGGGGGSTFKLVAGENLVAGNGVRTSTLNRAFKSVSRSLPVFAVALETVLSGATGLFQDTGPVDPAIFNVGAGVACAVGLNAADVPVRATDPACVTQTNWIGFCDTQGAVTLGIVTRPDYWAPDYGCPCDGLHDDLPGIVSALVSIDKNTQAQVLRFPDASLWISDSLYVNRNVILKGTGGTNQTGTVIQVPSGKGIFFDNAAVNTARGGDGGSSDFAQIEDIRIQSVNMIYNSANTPPSTGGGGPAFNANPGFGALASEALGGVVNNPMGGQRVDSRFYEVGSVMVRGAAPNFTCMFRCTVAGTTQVGEPGQWTSTIAGVAFADGTSHWVSEMIPQDYLVGHTYRVGDRVFIQGKTDYYFECTVAGTSTIAQSDANFQNPGYYAGSVPAQEKFVDAGSGTLTWQTKTHAPLIITCNQGSSRGKVYFRAFTTCIIFLSTVGGPPPLANTDFWNFENWYFYACGGGVKTQGFDSNGIRGRDSFDYYCATGRNQLNATIGAGGFAVYDKGLRNEFQGWYSQDRIGGGAGPAYYTDTASTGTFIDCDAERTIGDIFLGNNTIVRQSFAGIQYGQSSSNINIVDVNSQNVWEYEWAAQTTTNVVFQTLLQVPGTSQPNQSFRVVVVIQAKRTGNHASYLTATCIADRGVNAAGGQEQGTDLWSVTTWGTENSLAGTIFDLNIAGGANTVRVTNPPAYSVDYTITVQITRLAVP